MHRIAFGALAARLLISASGIAAITFLATRTIPMNPTSVGFAYLLFVLVIASTWGFVEALLASILATLAYNFYFLPPVGTFTIADPQNWVALFSFLLVAIIASRLSDKAQREALDALSRQKDIERLYTFSRSILLVSTAEPFPKQLVQKLADIFGFEAAVLFDRRSGEIYRAGPADFDGMEEQLREAALNGTFFTDPAQRRVITGVRLGSEPIAGLALQGVATPDSVLQGIANLVAIGLEHARAQDLAHQAEAARQSERLRATLIDAMAHELKTPLTSIKAATTSLLAHPDQPAESRRELLNIADEEAEHLKKLIDDALEMARLDTDRIEVHLETWDLAAVVREVIAEMRIGIDGRKIEVIPDPGELLATMDRHLVKLALKQLLDNALKYSPQDSAIGITTELREGSAILNITDHGQGIPAGEQSQVFNRFYRSPSVQAQIPGSGLGLSIAYRIARAHHGDLTVTSRPGETSFHLSLPASLPKHGAKS